MGVASERRWQPKIELHKPPVAHSAGKDGSGLFSLLLALKAFWIGRLSSYRFDFKRIAETTDLNGWFMRAFAGKGPGPYLPMEKSRRQAKQPLAW